MTAGSFAITWNADNGLPEMVSGGNFSQGRTFNGYGELDSMEYDVSGMGIYSWSAPSRDAAGRIARKVESIGGVTITWDYSYDGLGRLVEVRKDGTIVESYGYDLNGNRVAEVNLLRGVDRSSTYSDEDHVIMAGDDLYQFDVDGFLVSRSGSDGITGYAYSSRGELLEVVLPGGTLVTYEHDPLGRRIAKYVDGVINEKYLWADMTTLLAVYDGNDTLLMRFEYADSRLPVSMASGGGEYFLMYDQVGSLRVVTDTSGTIIKQVDYDSFGNVIGDSNSSFEVPFGFAGGLYDTDTGLVRFGFRDYDPALGRWTAKDPIDFGGGDWNLYGYCLGDPVNLVDPLGLHRWGYPHSHSETNLDDLAPAMTDPWKKHVTFYPSYWDFKPIERQAIMIHEAFHFEHPWRREGSAYGYELHWINTKLGSMDSCDPNRAILQDFKSRIMEWYRKEYGKELVEHPSW